MSESELIELPDFHSLSDERLQILWILAEEGKTESDGLLTSYAISRRLEQHHRICIPRHRVNTILQREKGGTVLRKLKRSVEYWKLMRPGEIELTNPPATAMFINPKEAFSARRRVGEILSSLSGQLRFCDPYIDVTILDALSQCTKSKSIKVLSSTIQGAAFANEVAAFNREFGGRLQVRTVAKGRLHDRYIIHDGGMILIGASLKDLGRAPSFVVALGPDLTSAVSEQFDSAWNGATSVG